MPRGELDEMIVALLLARVADDVPGEPHPQSLLDQPAQRDLAGASRFGCRSAWRRCRTAVPAERIRALAGVKRSCAVRLVHCVPIVFRLRAASSGTSPRSG